MAEWLRKQTNPIIPQFDWFAPHSFASAVPSAPASLNSSSSSNVPPVNFSLTLLPELKQKPFGFWMTSFIWLPPMADVTGIFCFFFPGGTANFGDWTTFSFALCLQNLAPGLEHRGPSKSVCGFASSQEGCGQCVYTPQSCVWACSWPQQRSPYSESSPPLLGQRSGTLTLADTLWGLLTAMVEGPFCTSSLCTCPSFQWKCTSLSLGHWRWARGWEKGQGFAPCSSVPQG